MNEAGRHGMVIPIFYDVSPDDHIRGWDGSLESPNEHYLSYDIPVHHNKLPIFKENNEQEDLPTCSSEYKETEDDSGIYECSEQEVPRTAENPNKHIHNLQCLEEENVVTENLHSIEEEGHLSNELDHAVRDCYIFGDETESESCHSSNEGFSHYPVDIYVHRRSIESRFVPQNFLSKQTEITAGMRSILCQWLAKVNKHFSYSPDTHSAAVNILDRFLQTTQLSRDCFQLMGVTALLVASKMEEIYPPELPDLTKLCCNEYTIKQIKQLEWIVLAKLNFDVLIPTPNFFLEYHIETILATASMLELDEADVRKTGNLGQYVIELSLQDYSIAQCTSSMIALAALTVAEEALGHNITSRLVYAADYPQEQLLECIEQTRLVLAPMFEDSVDIGAICSVYGTPLKMKGECNKPGQ